MEEIKSKKIQWLPKNLISQLKAGEMIERPSQAIKELIENSLDAGATEIFLSIEEAGLKKIELEDNGTGMNEEDLLIAFEPHTTSKLNSIFDLFKLSSYGFRGEALSSLRSVAEILCESDDGIIKSKISFKDGEKIFLKKESSLKQGTKVFVYNLFKNHPVRLKFLQSHITEKKQIKKNLLTFLILKEKVNFKIKIDEEIYFYSSEKKYERISRFYKIDEVFKNEKKDESYEIFLVKGKHDSLIYVNNRFIYHYGLKKFLEEKFQSKFIIFLEVKKENIDINVHPQKTQIKFLKEQELFSFLNEIKIFNKEENHSLKILKNYNKYALIKDFYDYYIFDILEAKRMFLKEESKKRSFEKIPFPEKTNEKNIDYVLLKHNHITHFLEGLSFSEFKDVLINEKSITSKELLKKLLMRYSSCKRKLEEFIK